MPKVSICIPTYNRCQLLQVAIESAIAQTYSDFELLICDDGSTDETPQLMSQLTDGRIHYIRHRQNIGKSNNMRSGFEAARGDYFIKFDDDDRLTEEFLARTTAILEQNATVDFVGTDHWVIDINNQRDEATTNLNSQRWGRAELPAGITENLLEVVFIRQSFQVGATLFRREVLQELEFMRPNMQSCEDNDLFVRMALAGKKGYYLPERLMEYRFHAQQQEIDKAIAHFRNKVQYLSTYEFESEKLEKVRRSRIAQTKLLLGLRLIEMGETTEGSQLVREGKSHSPTKAWTGLALSRLPAGLRGHAFNLLRHVRS